MLVNSWIVVTGNKLIIRLQIKSRRIISAIFKFFKFRFFVVHFWALLLYSLHIVEWKHGCIKEGSLLHLEEDSFIQSISVSKRECFEFEAPALGNKNELQTNSWERPRKVVTKFLPTQNSFRTNIKVLVIIHTKNLLSWESPGKMSL